MSDIEMLNRNRPFQCDRCGKTVYLHPKFRRLEKGEVVNEFMDEQYEDGMDYSQFKKEFLHKCVTEPQNKKYNYQEKKLPDPDQVYKNLKPRMKKQHEWMKDEDEDEEVQKSPAKLNPQTQFTKNFIKDVEEMKSEISDIKSLLVAVIKIFDEVVKNNNKDGSSLLFKKAINMVDKETEQRAKIEEQKKTDSETDNVDSDDGYPPKESTTSVTKKEETVTEKKES